MSWLKMTLTITFLSLLKIALCQQQLFNLEYSQVDQIDSNLLFMLNNHVEIINLDSNTAISENIIHIIFISPKYYRDDGIPGNIIDSLYKEIHFPPPIESPGYSVAILSILDSCPAIRLLNDYPEKYGYFKTNMRVFVLSKLKINNFISGKSISITFHLCKETCEPEVSSTYLWSRR